MVRNKLVYAVAGSEGLYRNGHWIFDLKSMPVDAFLYNAVHFIGRGKELEMAVEQKRQADEAGKIMICDSGGFQLATGTISSLDPAGVASVQNRTATLGFICDVPPLKRVGEATANGLDFDSSDEYLDECLVRTLKHLKLAKDVKRDFWYYAVIQGATMKQMLYWWEELLKVDTFDGVGTKSISFEQMLIGAFMLDKIDAKRHHFLGLGASQKLAVLRYFYLCNPKSIDLITYDNTNAIQYAKYMGMVLPFSGASFSKGGNVEEFTEQSGVVFNEVPGEVEYVILRNIYFYGMQNRFLNMLDTANTAKDFVRNNYPNAMRYINVVDDYFDKGIDYVLKRYTDLNFKVSGAKSTNVMSFLGN